MGAYEAEAPASYAADPAYAPSTSDTEQDGGGGDGGGRSGRRANRQRYTDTDYSHVEPVRPSLLLYRDASLHPTPPVPSPKSHSAHAQLSCPRAAGIAAAH